jgi:hypothetical protein
MLGSRLSDEWFLKALADPDAVAATGIDWSLHGVWRLKVKAPTHTTVCYMVFGVSRAFHGVWRLSARLWLHVCIW